MKPLLIFQGPVATRSGYGDHARDLLRSLIAMDKFDIKVISLRWGNCPMNALTDQDRDIADRIFTGGQLPKPDIFVQVSVPNEFMPHGKYNIGITAGIETTLVHQEWIQGCNRMDLIIVPSEHSKQTLLDTVYSKVDERTKQKVGELKCEKPVEILFEGVDINTYKQTDEINKTIVDELKSIPEDYCFLNVGHWLHGRRFHDRKDISGCIHTFCSTFNGKSSRPALILKSGHATFSVIDRVNTLNRINEIKQEFSDPPNIYLLHGDLTDDEMNSLYNHPKVKAMVSFTKGEGYGRPLAEFSTTGKPILATWWSGQKDFLKHCYRIVGQVAPLDQSSVWDKVLLEGSNWFHVNYRFAKKAFKDLYVNYKKHTQNGKRQKHHINKNFTLEQMNSKMVEILEQYGPKQETELTLPSFDSIELPTLSKVGE